MYRTVSENHPILRIRITGPSDIVYRGIKNDVSDNVDSVFKAGNFSMEKLDKALVIYSKWFDFDIWGD